MRGCRSPGEQPAHRRDARQQQRRRAHHLQDRVGLQRRAGRTPCRLLHHRHHHQPERGTGGHPPRRARPELHDRQRLRLGVERHRRGMAVRARRRLRRGHRGRHRRTHRPDRDRRLRELEGGVAAQRRARARQPSVRSRPRRLRPVRGRRPWWWWRTLEHARARGAKIYAEIIGYATRSEAFHIAAPLPDGLGAAATMQAAIDKRGHRVPRRSTTSTRTPPPRRSATSTRRRASSSRSASARIASR